MSTTISVIGGVGLFLLGMTVMTAGLKGLAGSGLRTALSKAVETPLRGAFWGGVATLLVQSSSATTMTTIGLVSAGLLTFPQGPGARVWRERGHHGHRVARCAHRRARFAHSRRVADDLRRRVDEVAGSRARVRGGRGARRIRVDPVRTDDPAAGDGRAGRTA